MSIELSFDLSPTFHAEEFVAKLIGGEFHDDWPEQIRKLSYDELEIVEYLVEKHLGVIYRSSAGRWRVHLPRRK